VLAAGIFAMADPATAQSATQRLVDDANGAVAVTTLASLGGMLTVLGAATVAAGIATIISRRHGRQLGAATRA